MGRKWTFTNGCFWPFSAGHTDDSYWLNPMRSLVSTHASDWSRRMRTVDKWSAIIYPARLPEPLSARPKSRILRLALVAGLVDGPIRRTLLGIAQVVMLGELAVNRALDRVEVTD